MILEPTEVLWTAVKPRTGWIDTNEDTMRQLAASWRDAGSGFSTLGLSPLWLSSHKWRFWRGEAANAFEEMLFRLDNLLQASSAAMRELAGLVDAFAADVTHAKSEIGRVITATQSFYDSTSSLAPEIGAGLRTHLVDRTAAEINSFLDEMAGRIAARRASHEVGEPPTLETPDAPEPPDEGPPWKAIGDWAGIASTFFGAASFVAPVALPLAVISGAVALAAHSTDVAERTFDGYQGNDPGWGDAFTVAADTLGAVSGSRAIAEALRVRSEFPTAVPELPTAADAFEGLAGQFASTPQGTESAAKIAQSVADGTTQVPTLLSLYGIKNDGEDPAAAANYIVKVAELLG